ncbi:MAG: gamma-glutamyltransferase [Rariglobus sp.]
MTSRVPRLACSLLLAASIAAETTAGSHQATDERGVVVAASAEATQAGIEILRAGGNAVDASVAVGLALAVTYPRAGNIGGGGFLLLRDVGGAAEAIDYRETAPAAAFREMYFEGPAKASVVGHRAAGVPGTVAGLALALERHGSGKFTWAQLVEPARKLAAEGFIISEPIAKHLSSNSRILEPNAESTRIFLRGGNHYAAGERLVQPELAATLARLQKDGPREFYEGETARLLVAEMKANGGLINADDLRNYRAVVREPLRMRYRGHEILTMPPPSSGGVVIAQMLAMLEPFDLVKMRPDARAHLLIEVMKRGFHDRASFVADPDFVPVPMAGLLAPEYLAARMTNFDPAKATPSSEVGGPAPAGAELMLKKEKLETTHYSVIDAAGNAVSNTYTLNGHYGNGVTVTGAGFLLNNEMDDFTTRPGAANIFGLIQGEANSVAAGKRPLSSMTPTIVLKDGEPCLILGSPGGPTIINIVLQVMINVIDLKMTAAEANAAPRLHHQWMPDEVTYEPGGMTAEVANALIARGHSLGQRQMYWTDSDRANARRLGDAAVIFVDPKTKLRHGSADPRSGSSSAAGQGGDSKSAP